MKISIITLFPTMIKGFFEESIIKRAQEKGLVEIEIIDLREFAIDKYKSVDDRPYGGGAGMVLRVDILHKALSIILNEVKDLGRKTVKNASLDSSVVTLPRNDKGRIVLTSAKGKVFNQKKAQEYSKLENLIIIAGHYEGVDERVLEYVDEEISLGDFVMTGGEITVAAVIDSIVRLLPGVLKKKRSF